MTPSEHILHMTADILRDEDGDARAIALSVNGEPLALVPVDDEPEADE